MEYDIRRLQEVQLELLDELARVCGKCHIRFYLAAGSCIGAVRHQGFIPWDDDIDTFMYAEDADRLFEHADDFGEGFFLQNADTDKGYGYSIARLRKRGTACLEKDELNDPCHHGIFLDIYLLYYYPASRIKRALMVGQGICRNILLRNKEPQNHGRLIGLLGKMILLPYRNNEKRRKKVKALTAKIRQYRNTDDLVILYGMDISLKRIISYKTAWFQAPQMLPFEGRTVPVATDVDAYLTCRYGADYMQLPPPEKRHSYHEYAYISFDHEYEGSRKSEKKG